MAYKQTYDTVGKKDDMLDLITNISPDETPIMSHIGVGKPANQIVVTWLEDELGDPKDNAQIEAFEYTIEEVEPRKIYGNMIQRFWRGFGVSKDQEAIDKHGVKSEMAYQKVKVAKLFARDIEAAVLRQYYRDITGNVLRKEPGPTDTDAVTLMVGKVGVKNSTASRMGGIPSFIRTNNFGSGDELRLFEEEHLLDAMQAIWQIGGTPDSVYTPPSLKRRASTFLNRITLQSTHDEKKLYQGMDIYDTDFGIVKLYPHRMMAADPANELAQGQSSSEKFDWRNAALVMDTQYFSMRYLRPPKDQPLPDDIRDVYQRGIIAVGTLEVRAEKASAIIHNIAGKASELDEYEYGS